MERRHLATDTAVTRHRCSAGILPASRHPQGRFPSHECSAELPTVSPSISVHGRQDAGATVERHRRHAPLLERRHLATDTAVTRHYWSAGILPASWNPGNERF